MANIQQLPSHDETIAVRLRFDLEIDLIGLGPVEYLSDIHGSRAYSWCGRLHNAVE
jgi:hypothetical protein